MPSALSAPFQAVLIALIALSASPALADDNRKSEPPRRSGEARTPALEPELGGEASAKPAATEPDKPHRDGEAAPKSTADSATARRLERFEITGEPFRWTMTRDRVMRTYTRWQGTFPSAVKSGLKENDTVRISYYRPRGKGAPTAAKPGHAVLILHHLGGGHEAEEVFAAYLATNGIAAATMRFPFYGKRRPEGFKKQILRADPRTLGTFIRQAVADVRRASDVLRSLPETRKDRIGLAGVSLGAVIGSLACGIDARFHRVSLILGGGRLDQILTSDAPEVTGIREWLESRKVDRKTLRSWLDGCEPCHYAHRVETRRILMLNAWNDEIIPRRSTLALHKAFGEPKIHWYQTGHYGAALHIFNILRRSKTHLAEDS